MSDVYVMGVDMIKFGNFQTKCSKYWSRSSFNGLDDVGLGIQICKLYIAKLGQANAMVVRGFFKK